MAIQDLVKLELLLGEVRRRARHEVKVHTFQVFLAIANEKKPISSTTLITRTNLDQRTISRDTTQLGTRMVKHNGSYKAVGFGLVEARPDAYESRMLAYSLTKRGKKLFADLIKILY